MSQIQIIRLTILSESRIEDINTILDDGKVWDLEEGEKFLKNTNTIFLLAYYDNHPAGFLYGYLLQRFDKKKAEVLLYEIAVTEEYRQKGIGKALIEKLKIWTKGTNTDEIWVITNRSNIAGMKLYESAGGTIESSDEQMFTFKI